MSVEATMEFLPQDIIEHICQHLNASDLASCCAVSHNWREMFGEDRLWRVHCDQTLADHLDVNSCVVEPHFTSPEAEDTTLSAISEWRLNYMKEVHLRNNWSLGNFKKEDLYIMKDKGEMISCKFFKKHYVLLFKQCDLEVWDVKATPTFKSRMPFNFKDKLFPFGVYEVNGSNIFVIVESLVVRVYSLCSATYKLELLHVFNFEMTEKCSESTEEVAQELRKGRANFECGSSFVVGNFLVATVSANAYKMHIWNLETGQMIKVEEVPFHDQNFVLRNACEKTMNVVLEGRVEMEGKFIHHWYVYSLARLMFLPFHRVQELQQDGSDYLSTVICSAIISDKFIAIIVDDTLTVCNYLTSEILYTAPVDGGYSFFFRNYIVFRHNRLNVVNPNNQTDRMCPNDVKHRYSVTHAGNLAIIAKRMVSDVSDISDISDISIKCTSFKTEGGSIPLCQVSYQGTCLSNKPGTKMILEYNIVSSKLIIVHFW